MNAGGEENSINPIEHIYSTGKAKGVYKYYVEFFAQKLLGPTTSRFEVFVYGENQ